MPFVAVHFHLFHRIHILPTVERWMGTDWGYGVLFGLLLSCGLGVPLPEDIPLLLAGYFVANGQMHLGYAAICGWCGIIGGDCILYFLGRRFGLAITKVPVIGSHLSKERIDRAHVLFEKYGIWVVAVGRLFAGIRAAMVVTAGTIRFTFSHFLIADGLAAIVSGGLFMSLGYWARHHFGDLEQIETRVEQSQRIVLAGLIVIAVIFGSWKGWESKRKADRKRKAIEHAKIRQAASTDKKD